MKIYVKAASSEIDEVFTLLENDKECWEKTAYGDIWAINYDKAVKLLKAHGIKTPEQYISYIADFYGMDIT